MKKHILVFGAGKSATVLIDYLKTLLAANNWTLTVADSNLELARLKTGGAAGTEARGIDVHEKHQRSVLIKQADVVISLLPPSLHFIVARDCCSYHKHLLTASYVSDDIRMMSREIEANHLLFLCEMGLDPGIDHMSAMQIIDRLKTANASITSFTSHCGGLVAPESDDNPWHYKISWNAANVVKAGTGGAVYKEKGEMRFLTYQQLFENCREVEIPSAGTYSYYPNRDSLSYTSVYKLENTSKFLRTTLRHPAFCSGWNCIVKSGLASETIFTTGRPVTFKQWSAPILPYLNAGNMKQFEYLGFFDPQPVPIHLNSSAAILQFLLEKHLMLRDHDKDLVIMMHEFVYTIGASTEKLTSSLVVKGEDHLHTAMAKTVGLPLGIAAKLLLQERIALRGLHIPVMKAIYEPVLQELETHQVDFIESIESIR